MMKIYKIMMCLVVFLNVKTNASEMMDGFLNQFSQLILRSATHEVERDIEANMSAENITNDRLINTLPAKLPYRMSVFLDGPDGEEYRFVGNLELISKKKESHISYVKYVLKKLGERDSKAIAAVGGVFMALYGVARLFV